MYDFYVKYGTKFRFFFFVKPILIEVDVWYGLTATCPPQLYTEPNITQEERPLNPFVEQRL